MPYRGIVFANNEIYHIVNRGVAQTPIFTSPKEYQRFLEIIDFYQYANPVLCFSHFSRLSIKDKGEFMKSLKEKESLGEIYAYCLMPNHFHVLLKQTKNMGIPKMFANIQNSYARYFNLKQKRQGPLFQSRFRAVRIETDEQLLHVSRYIHLNPVSSYLIEVRELPFYNWSSFPEYLGKRTATFINSNEILKLSGGINSYQKFVIDQVEYQRELEKIKHLTLESP